MDAVFLDIDGTLWDSTGPVAEVWNQVLENRPDIAFRATPQKLRQLFGKTLDEIASIIFPELPKEEQLHLIDLCCEKEHDYLAKHPGIIFEGVQDTIKELAKICKVCIVSNCEAGYIELVMDALGITEYISDFECPGYSGRGKGYNCLAVKERNHFSSVLYVGDTQGDLEACRFSGIPFVYCKYGFGNPLQWDYSIEKFSELLPLCTRIN